MRGVWGSGGWPAGAELREESEAVNESFWDATGVEIEAKQVLGKMRVTGLTWIFGRRGRDLDFLGLGGSSRDYQYFLSKINIFCRKSIFFVENQYILTALRHVRFLDHFA